MNLEQSYYKKYLKYKAKYVALQNEMKGGGPIDDKINIDLANLVKAVNSNKAKSQNPIRHKIDGLKNLIKYFNNLLETNQITIETNKTKLRETLDSIEYVLTNCEGPTTAFCSFEFNFDRTKPYHYISSIYNIQDTVKQIIA
jgi:hypothetical protein